MLLKLSAVFDTKDPEYLEWILWLQRQVVVKFRLYSIDSFDSLRVKMNMTQRPSKMWQPTRLCFRATIVFIYIFNLHAFFTTFDL